MNKLDYIKDSIERKSFPFIMIFFLTIGLGLGIGVPKLMKENVLERKQKEKFVYSLVQDCNNKASGMDNILSFDEGISLAEKLNYKKIIYDKEFVCLKNYNNRIALLIGYEHGKGLWGTKESWRDFIEVSPLTLQNYLNE